MFYLMSFFSVGLPEAASRGAADCTEDYIVIPGGITDAGEQADRFCGLGFPNSVSCK